MTLNTEQQMYRGIPIRAVPNVGRGAVQFKVNGSIQTVWIPKKHLRSDGTLKPNQDLDYVFRARAHQLFLAGINQAIPGIKKSNDRSFETYVLTGRTRM